jgi:acyl dehydratase
VRVRLDASPRGPADRTTGLDPSLWSISYPCLVEQPERAMTETLNGFDTEPMFKWSEPGEFLVTREQLIAYAEATNDDIPAHRAGDIASPVFNVAPQFKVSAPLTLTMPPEHLRMNGLHGEQDFRFHRPMEPGMRLISRAMPIGIIPHSTGATITVKSETTADGEMVTDQYVTVFIRGAKVPQPLGEGPPEHRVPRDGGPLIAEVTRGFDSDQTFRYRDASGDDMPIHTDDEVARSFGLPGIILHGNCTLAFATRTILAATCDDDTRRLKRLAVRYSRIVQPHEKITTRVWAGGERDGRRIYGFETAVDDGSLCLSNGLVEVV